MATRAHKMASIEPSPPGVPHAESQGPLRYAFCTVPCKLSVSGGGPRQSWHHNSRAKTHSRHNSTVLPRLGSNRMESYQNLHTHALDSAIQLQGNNRVLKRSPPISDEEQRLSRRQRCTLSQLTVRTQPSIVGLQA